MKRDLRILSISLYGGAMAYEAQFSGALDRQRDYATALAEYVVVVPGASASEARTDHGDGFILYALPARGHLAFVRAVLARVRSLHASHHFDAVMVDNPHLAGILGVIVSRLLGLPLIVHSMADMLCNPWYRKERALNRLKEILVRFVLRRADLIRVSTTPEVERLQACARCAGKVVRVPFYVDQNVFAGRLAAADDGAEKKRPKTALFVGRLGSQKDIGTLLRAFSLVHERHPDAELLIVGGGDEEAMLRRLAKQLKIKNAVVFTGAIAYDEVPKLFLRADVFVIASLYEGTCMVLHEAAVAGLPIVATAFAGAIEFVRDGVDGRVVPVRDVQAFATALAELFDDTERARAMGEAAHARVALFARERALAAWEELCDQIVAMRKR
jgi:1,2-diacylglycerol 3-alpha-glucosyltransferase